MESGLDANAAVIGETPNELQLEQMASLANKMRRLEEQKMAAETNTIKKLSNKWQMKHVNTTSIYI